MSEFERLLSGFIDDTLTDEERQRLAELIQSNSEYRSRYLDYCSMHATLAWEHGVLGGKEIPEVTQGADEAVIPFPQERVSRSWRRSLSWAASIGALLAIFWQGVLPEVKRSQWQANESIGSIVRKSGGQLSVTGSRIRLEQGDSVKVGEYELTDGLAQFELENEVQIFVEAPARFRVDSAWLVSLYEGRLSANVPPEGVGFTVETPSAQVIDHGTEFGVEVDSNQRSEVHVFEGEVEIKARDTVVKPVRLLTDQATRVDTDSGESSGIAIAPERFIRSFDEPILYYSNAVRELEPAVYYRMAISDDGVTLLDRSGNDVHGLIHRGEMMDSAFAAGRIGAALQLQGVDSKAFALVSDYPKAKDGALSVVAWVHAESRPTWASIAKNWAFGEVGQFHFGLKHYQGGLELQLREADGDTVYVSEETPLPLGEWQHVAFVADGKFARLYRNGVEVARSRHQGLATPTFPSLGIGAKLKGKGNREQEGSVGYWDGRIDELAIFNHALSAEDIERLYLAPEKSDLLSVR